MIFVNGSRTNTPVIKFISIFLCAIVAVSVPLTSGSGQKIFSLAHKGALDRIVRGEVPVREKRMAGATFFPEMIIK
jgi:hypothetical protein